MAIEAKRLGSGISPYVIPAEVADFLGAEVYAQESVDFAEYGAILRDTCVPTKTLRVAISQARGISHFEALMAANAVPGAVHVVPE